MFDFSPAHIVILLIVVVLLFGASRLPKAAKSLGSSMKIFKNEVQGLHSDEETPAPAQPAAAVAPAPAPAVALPQADATQQQLNDLQRQLADLQRQNAANGQAGTQAQQSA